jgi:RNA polymerase sigma factor (sigma-70 family)
MKKINVRELKELFIEIKYGNKIAFEKLYNNYNKLIYSIAYSILKNKQDAEDIVQIVFEKLYLIDKEKLPNRNESSWLYSITKNETINYLKRNKNNIDLDSIYNIEDENNEINKIIDQDNYNRLISKLNNKEKEIISLKIISNLSFEEIGKLLKEPTGTIKWRYYKAVNTLKILLSNLGMFIITFVIGIKTLFNKKASDKVEQDKTIGNNTTEQTAENTNAETKKGQENLKDEVKSDVSESQDKETKNEINIVSQPTNTEIINNSGVCILSISFIFLIITIIFSIILAKYQLKLRKKLSK